MTVPSMEELVETFARAWLADRASEHVDQKTRTALLAVLDRLKPVIEDAHTAGIGAGLRAATATGWQEGSATYAAAVIDQIKGA